MTTADHLQAALAADFLRRYRGLLAVLMHRARRYAAACRRPLRGAMLRCGDRHVPLRQVRRIALLRAAGRLYRLCDRWGGLGVFPPVGPDTPELPLLQAVVELAAARRDGDRERRRRWARALCRAARVVTTERTAHDHEL